MTKDKISILFDAGPILGNSKTGVGYYVENMVNALASDKSISLDGYYFNFLDRHQEPATHLTNVAFRSIRFFPSKLLSLFRRLGFQPNLNFLVKGRYRYTLFTNYIALPTRSSTNTAVFIYDLGFMDCPEFLQEANLKALKRFCPPSINNASIIVTISDFTKERILHHFPDTKAEIVVTPIPPVRLTGEIRPLGNRLRQLGIKNNKYFLYLGTLEPRKNIAMLVRAYSLLPDKIRSEFALVLSGGRGWKDTEIVQEIETAKANGVNIIQTGYVSDDEKDALYSNASCFVLPSHYEGFGMPILEAVSHDIPVILSDIPVFHEVAKDAALYFNKDDAEDISNKLTTIVTDTKLRSDLVVKGRKVLNDFDSWNANARKVTTAIKTN